MSTFQNIDAVELSQNELNMVEGGTLGLISWFFGCMPKAPVCPPPTPPTCYPPAPPKCH